MTGDRVYTVQRYDVVEPAAANHNVAMVVLTLAADGSFTLLVASSASDWGDRHETTERYRGGYEDSDVGVECHATLRTRRERHSDHELGTSSDETQEDVVHERFAFKRRGEGGLICPIDHDGLGGVLMSEHLAPHPCVF